MDLWRRPVSQSHSCGTTRTARGCHRRHFRKVERRSARLTRRQRPLEHHADGSVDPGTEAGGAAIPAFGLAHRRSRFAFLAGGQTPVSCRPTLHNSGLASTTSRPTYLASRPVLLKCRLAFVTCWL